MDRRRRCSLSRICCWFGAALSMSGRLPKSAGENSPKPQSKRVEWSGGATGLDQWLPSYQPFRASWQTALGSCRSFLRPLYSFLTAGSQPGPPAPFRILSGLRLTQKLPFTRFWPFLIQASGKTVVPTGPWLSTVHHVRACKRYYGLIRQSDELRPAWLSQLTLAGLCPCGPFASPSLLCLVMRFASMPLPPTPSLSTKSANRLQVPRTAYLVPFASSALRWLICSLPSHALTSANSW